MERKPVKDNENNFNIVNIFYNASPFIKSVKLNHELEVKFGTRGVRPFSKIDYDKVIQKLKSFDFVSANEQGNYLLRIQNEYLDPKSGQFRMSQIRTEITGFHPIPGKRPKRHFVLLTVFPLVIQTCRLMPI